MNPISQAINTVIDHTSGIYRRFNSAIIVAAGSGTRASTTSTKQMVKLNGKPLIAHTVSAFEACKFINEIVLVIKSDERPLYEAMAHKYEWKKPLTLVTGGATRQASVLEGFKAISDRSEYVYIHDGARCLITEEMIAAVGHKACLTGAAFAACRPHDTVKKQDASGVTSTIDRDQLWLAQTPQVFMTEMYRAAAYRGLQQNLTVTDDAQLIEAAGFAVTPVDCGTQNIKVTHPCDFAIAEAILAYRYKA